MIKTNISQNNVTNVTLVDLLTWVYRDQRAHLMSDVELALYENGSPHSGHSTHSMSSHSVDSCARIIKDRRLGATIPSTSARQRLVLHPDAEAVHLQLAHLSHLDPYSALLIFRHARRGETPDYCDDVPIPQPVQTLDQRGRNQVVECMTKPGDGHIEQRTLIDPETGTSRLTWVEVSYPYCPLTYWPSIECIASSRLDYRLWINGLILLIGHLPALKDWVVCGLGADPQPWGWDNDNTPSVA